MKDVHAGFTPRSTLAWMQIYKTKRINKNISVNNTQNIFMKKSTLNKH